MPPTLLCISNEPTAFGFAWTHFEELYARIADRVAKDGVRTLVAYPRVTGPVPAFAQSTAQVMEFDAMPNRFETARALAKLVRQEDVRAIFFIDRRSLHWFDYGLPRLAGVRRVLVYNQTSGLGYQSSLPKRMGKWVLARLPWMTPDAVIGVSDFVVKREIETNLLSRQRVTRVYNAVALPPQEVSGPPLHERLGIDPSRPVIITGCRAVREKGVDHLFRAFDVLMSSYPAERPRPMLVYVGSGPQMAELERLRQSLPSGDSIMMIGYRADVGELHVGAAICAVPSVFQDACPFAVLEAMARGCAIVGTRVGGVPEMIDSEDVGLLVPPGDPAAMAAAFRRLLDDPDLRAEMGRRARERVRLNFDPETQVTRLVDLITPAFRDVSRDNGAHA
jgi:glycosyltransferase involved in cell wall biosynthesis